MSTNAENLAGKETTSSFEKSFLPSTTSYVFEDKNVVAVISYEEMLLISISL
ncbi:MAG: hypothetical protein CLLPBCKN_000447 [Chroococcidiopsis cubana SAG 39.79]|uniref:Uncharacterized protein n=1 Tax=Chroococcidiopsis cubana SAG 39.79 TaxID=388085 RepID=A0AB37UA05_9CYAN|nr:hypothetical protein [Chroococcidiopsis cubana]MDZ4871059.1 hypothetical protein [Chroococcidiopsis cubana SAG 39.79]RUT02346.1 hypothetical protein DSM107010_62860 [Chroococcidiopsis cubana SAG 39.79]